MGDLISRQNAINAWDKLSQRGRTEFDQVLMTLSSAEPPYQYSEAYVTQLRGERDILQDMVDNMAKRADRPTGEWINREKCQVDEDAYEVATCSECGAEITIEYPYDNYCPNCGCRMEGGDTE